jgi:WhiB family redox-sensing transcriptional regulator
VQDVLISVPPESARHTPCQQIAQDLWFDQTPAGVETAKQLCRPCPVLAACLAGALLRREPWGVWGGELLSGGVVLARKPPIGRPRKDAVRQPPAA